MARTITGFPELDMVLAALEKDFGKGFVTMGPKYEVALPIPTGSVSLDAFTGIGGMPRGRIIEVYGHESSGKTSFCLHLMKQYRKYYPEDTRPMAVIEVEESISGKFMEGFGLNPKDIVFLHPNSAEQALQALVNLNASGAVSVILLDSVDGLQSEEFLKKSIGEADMKGIAKLMGQTIRQVSKTCIANDVTNLMINQLRDTMSMYGEKHTTPGGKALRFYATMRLEFMTQKPSPNIPHAFLWRPKLIKNKCGEPHKENLEIDFVYAKGPDPYVDLFNYGKSIGLLRTAGQAVMYRLGIGAPEERLCLGGKAGAIEFLAANPEMYEKLREACVVKSLVVANAAPGEGTTDEAEPTEEELGDG